MTALLAAALVLQQPALAVRAKFDELFAASSLPGLSACVVLPDGTQVLMAAGCADEDRKTPLTPEHRFLGGSSGKTFFAALAMQLEKEGAIDLGAKLSDYLGQEPWYSRLPNGKTVTLSQLMHHQSGIPEHIDDPRFAERIKQDPLTAWTTAQMVELSLDKQPLFAPGEGWSYSDTNFILVAMAIEKKTGSKAYDMIEERFIKPLGLAHTEPSTKTQYAAFANGDHANGALFDYKWAVKGGRLLVNPQFEWAGGGFVTNPHDLALWIRSLVHGGVLDEATRKKMQTAVPARTGRDHEYAYGPMVRPSDLGKSYGHGGWYPGYITDVQHFPDKGVTACIMANSDDMRAFKINYQQYCIELARAATS